MRSRFIISLLTILLPSFSFAAKISPMFSAGIEFGGDQIVAASYTDGTTSNIEAGRGILLSAGALLDMTETIPHTFELQASIGLKWTSTKQANNGDIDFYRWPIEIISFYRNTENNFRLGVGLTYQFASALSGSNDASSLSTQYKNTFGTIFEGDYFFGEEKKMGLGLRYTHIQYQPQNSEQAINGNSLGINFVYVWF